MDAAFNKVVTLAKKLQEVCKVSFDHYITTADTRFADIAIITGMLVCSNAGCKHKGIKVIGTKIYCKDHAP